MTRLAKQHRISCETYAKAESAKASFFDSSVRWEEWAMDKGMAGNLIPEPSRSAGERIKLRSASHRIGCSAVLGGSSLRGCAGHKPLRAGGRLALRQSASGQTQFSTATILPWGPMLKGAGK